MDDKWICLNCNKVFYAGESYAKCCGNIERFDPVKHIQLLEGKSNAWIDVWNKWKDNDRLKEISQDMMNDGCFGASHHLNAFIESLLDV